MAKRDYYEILGVGHEANEQDLKSAYRKLAMQHHPDRNPDDPEAEERFKEASEAYSVLSDPQKKAAYDRYGHQGVPGAAQSGGPEGFADLSDIFGDLFGEMFGGGGGGRRRSRAQRGDDLRFDLEISFNDAVNGMKADIQAPRMEACSRCNSTGAEPGSGPVTCPTCHGRGEVLYQQSFLSIRRPCGTCGGSGQVVRNPCTECRGHGYQQVNRKLKVNIPAGVDDGTRVRLPGEGQHGVHGGPSGDLYVFLKVKPHAFFERNDADLHCAIPINIAQAALGAEIEVPTLEGHHKLKIAEGTQHGAEIKLRGKGVPRLNSGGRGDIIIHLVVKTPTRLTREQRKLFDQLRESLPTDNSPAEKGLFDKVKDYFM